MSEATWDDAERLRIRQAGTDDNLSVVRGLESLPACCVAKVISGTTAGQSYFTMEIQAVTGTEADGSAGVLTALTNCRFKACNLGATAPAVGTALICHRTSYRWVFRNG